MTRAEDTPAHHRPIRSFVRREGRLTPGQQRALERHWPRWGVEPGHGPLDLETLFGRRAPVTLEIGFGNGESLAQMAAADPERDFLGVEVHRPGVGHLLQRLEDLGLDNVRVASHDAVELVREQIPEAGLDCVQVFFPDPWPKKRHHKRRLIQPAFVQQLRRGLRPGGRLHLATDWEDYARHMLEVMTAAEGFVNTAPEDGFAPRGERPLTKFEQRGQGLGHGVWDLVFQRTPTDPHPSR
ncbi:tRNA (guanosine(46)-N7)-methyltransferase TrmB [Ectothiorhodospira mobilis]|uniref:tRNA (guanosine(46)-N7)-methyltransferase TrmB n=1 Tax=Ectothiorhodospira mobilis TaxID=195064 RepID=UPI00190419CC|nr:tRNA (guanosine(46)-N7)-methyltransferase TrmB [Ectothiorhodospira mobilis]MBK1692507.1 tRNA (guanosine(46)-N7)-methyltransferase TrmB [Ectothiorhodospira mobilis]